MLPLFISALFSLRSFRLKWPAPYRVFSTLLLSVFSVELMALLWKYYFVTIRNWPYSNSNLWLYNAFLVPQYLLYMAVYYQVIYSERIKRVIKVLAVLYASFAAVNLLFIQHVHTINSYTFVIASGIIIFLTVAYFEQFRQGRESMPLTNRPMGWISLGAFIFHAVSIPYMLGLNYLNSTNQSLATALFYIHLALNCIMYSFYTMAFLCKPPIHKQSA